jgi:hypothetical protein
MKLIFSVVPVRFEGMRAEKPPAPLVPEAEASRVPEPAAAAADTAPARRLKKSPPPLPLAELAPAVQRAAGTLNRASRDWV